MHATTRIHGRHFITRAGPTIRLRYNGEGKIEATIDTSVLGCFPYSRKMHADSLDGDFFLITLAIRPVPAVLY